MKTKQHVSTEMSLHVLAYNLKRTINIVGALRWRLSKRSLASQAIFRC